MRLALLLLALPLLAQDVSKRLVGTWRLVTYDRQLPNGEVYYPLGKDARGRLTYDAQGRMTAQLMQPDRPQFSRPQSRDGSEEQIVKAYRGYLAYYGTYTVHEKDGYILHKVEASLYPNWVGGNQKRFFRFEGERLVLEADAQALGRSRLVWEKLP
jgi:hypothetical protein